MLLAILILFTSSLITIAQSADSIHTEVDLVSVPFRANKDEQSRDKLLKSHPNLVNNRLWAALTKQAAGAYYEIHEL